MGLHLWFLVKPETFNCATGPSGRIFLSEPVLYETDAGAMLVQDGDVLSAQRFESGDKDEKLLRLGEEAKHMVYYRHSTFQM